MASFYIGYIHRSAIVFRMPLIQSLEDLEQQLDDGLHYNCMLCMTHMVYSYAIRTEWIISICCITLILPGDRLQYQLQIVNVQCMLYVTHVY